MSVLQSSGQPLHRPMDPRRCAAARRGPPSSTQAFTDLIGDDVDRLRIPVLNFIGYLRMLTLSSVHPMLDGQDSTASELVDVVLEGALRPPDRPECPPSTATASRTTRGKN